MAADSTHLEILKEFQTESKNLIEESLRLLEDCDGDFSQVKRLEDYGQTIDRIMGAAKSLAIDARAPSIFLGKIGDYAALCKAVGYKASQIKNNEDFFKICVALLIDATETLLLMIDSMFTPQPKFKELFSVTFLDRLRWVSAQFGGEYRATLEITKSKQSKMSQDEIDVLIAKLGLD